MNTVDRSQFNTLEGINNEIKIQEMLIHNHSADSWYTLEDAQEGLRVAKEAKRVFIYRAKPSLSKNGRALRP